MNQEQLQTCYDPPYSREQCAETYLQFWYKTLQYAFG